MSSFDSRIISITLQNTCVLVMVEGPGNKLKGEKMKATVVGQVELSPVLSANFEEKTVVIFSGGQSSGRPSCRGRKQKEHQLAKVFREEDC